MQWKLSKLLPGMTALTVLVVLALSLTQNAAAQNSSNSDAMKIEGTWRVQLTFRNCADGTPTGAAAQGMNTFIHGGSMIATPSASPLVIRTGHGVWAHTGGQNYTNKLVFFMYTAAGLPLGTQELTRLIELGPGPDEFRTADAFDVFDFAGNRIGGGCVSGVGKRLTID